MYYPKSQVTTNLYTNGGEYAKAQSGEVYIGPYWITSTGRAYTGTDPQTPNYELLAKIIPNSGQRIENRTVVGVTPPTEVFLTLEQQAYPLLDSDIIKPPKNLPTGIAVKPTENDYKIGEFTRFFCKKQNEIKYLELNQDTFDRLVGKDPTIVWELYFAYSIPWTLVGDKETVFRTNKRITELAITRNKLIGFAQFLKNDYLKYYRG
jgi:hypothetical protein